MTETRIDTTHSDRSVARDADDGPASGAEGEIRVLHVDDDRDLIELTAEYLQREERRLTVRTETSVESALEVIESEGIDCIVSDYRMTPIDGIEFLRTVREENEDLPFILLTGKGSEELAGRAISEGVTDYIRKGYGIDHYKILANRIVNAVEQYRSKRELEAKQKRLSLFFDQSPLGVIEWDENFELVRLNWTAQEILGYTEEELRGESWEAITTESDRDNVERVVSELVENKGGYHSISETVRKDGKEILCEWHNRVVTDENDDVVAIFSQFRDVTERKRREEAITNLHDVALELAECDTSEEIYDRTLDAAESLLSFDRSAIAVADGSALEVRKATDRTAAERQPARIEEGPGDRAYRTGETIRIDDVTAEDQLPSVDNHASNSNCGSIMYVPIGDRGVLQVCDEQPGAFDDTDVELAELLVQHAGNALERVSYEQTLERKTERLEEQNEELDEFVSVVSHDLRNPLQVLTATSELAEHRDDPEEYREYFERCGRAAERMERLLDNLVTLARDGDGLEPTPLEIQEVVEDCWRNVETKSASLRIEMDHRVIEADRSRVKQLFENLIRNAVEHGGEDVTITVGDLEDGFYVEDDGSGLPEGDVERLFERGYSGTSNGTGFGLAIVEQVADEHGWEIEATESDDGGARFDVSNVEFVR